MDLQLTGKHALITGASKGIGLSIALALAREGCSVCLVSRSANALTEAALLVRNQGNGHVETLTIDLGSPGAVSRIVAAQPNIDILVNNAGDIPGGALEEVDEAAWRAGWDVKVYGYINLSRAYLSRLRQHGGVILNIIGAAGEMLDPNYIAGAVGNAALMAFTRSLGSTSLDQGFRVLGINPGPVMTGRQQRILRSRAARRLGSEDRWIELEAGLPASRSATVEEIADTAAMLCSPLCGYMSGTVVTIDGGLSQRRSIV